MNMASLQIPPSEFRSRADRLLQHIKEEAFSGVVLFNNFYILYYTGFAFIPTERPVAFVMNAKGEQAMFVPRLEVEHARADTLVHRVDYYVEYPYEMHPMTILEGVLKEMEISNSFGADQDGYPWIFGYRGPSLNDILGRQPKNVTAFIEDQMMIKSPAELKLIGESVKWANLAHTLLHRYTRPGLTENEVSLRASNEATLRMLDAIGPIYRSSDPFSEGPSADYRGQIGRGASIPHALAGNVVFQRGDVLVSGAGAPVWGYNSELERTMILGAARDDQKRMFEHMLALQDTALRELKPGVRCCDVDRMVKAYFEKHELMDYWKHHSGHAIGLRYHEGPFLDLGDLTEIKPGMVFTVEPGLYVPDLGGFRHSDTVVITDEGIEIMTYYPRDLESLTIPV